MATSVGRISQIISNPDNAKWQIVDVGNGFVVRGWYRQAVHYWEWQGRTTVRVVGSGQYSSQDRVDGMLGRIGTYIRTLLDDRPNV